MIRIGIIPPYSHSRPFFVALLIYFGAELMDTLLRPQKNTCPIPCVSISTNRIIGITSRVIGSSVLEDLAHQILSVDRISLLDLQGANMSRMRSANDHFLHVKLAYNLLSDNLIIPRANVPSSSHSTLQSDLPSSPHAHHAPSPPPLLPTWALPPDCCPHYLLSPCSYSLPPHYCHPP